MPAERAPPRRRPPGGTVVSCRRASARGCRGPRRGSSRRTRRRSPIGARAAGRRPLARELDAAGDDQHRADDERPARRGSPRKISAIVTETSGADAEHDRRARRAGLADRERHEELRRRPAASGPASRNGHAAPACTPRDGASASRRDERDGERADDGATVASSASGYRFRPRRSPTLIAPNSNAERQREPDRRQRRTLHTLAAHGHRHARGARRPARRGRRRAVPPLRPHRHAVRRGLRDVPEHREAARPAAPARRRAARRSASPTSAIDEHGYVTATLPSTVAHESPTIAFFAHVDTAREVSRRERQPAAHPLRGRRHRARRRPAR